MTARGLRDGPRHLMDAEDGSRGTAARAALEKLLGTVPIDHVPRFDFYAATRSDRLCAPEPGPAPIVSKVLTGALTYACVIDN